MEVTFKKASIEDVEGLVGLCNECFEENTSLEYAKDLFKKTESDPNNIYLIGIENGKVSPIPKLPLFVLSLKI